jgi:hypothetical protein
MGQAAYSGKQNIAEGSKASVNSTEMELKLTNIDHASLEKLLVNYQNNSASSTSRCGTNPPRGSLRPQAEQTAHRKD